MMLFKVSKLWLIRYYVKNKPEKKDILFIKFAKFILVSNFQL